MNVYNQSKSVKIVVVLIIIFIMYLLIHHFSKPETLSLAIPVVEIGKPIVREMTEYITQTGTTVALNSVDLVARIEGYLTSIEFTDGSLIKKGQKLFVIQPEPYLEQLKSAQATVAAHKAAYAYAQTEYTRQQRMYRQNATSLNNVEKWLAKMHESEAEVAKAVANEQVARINYSYTQVLAPFDGKIGRHQVDVGNLVGNGKATNLATIDQIDSLYVYFNLNEIDLIKLRAAARKSGLKGTDLNKVPVEIKMQNAKEYTRKAQLDFVNTGLNAATGTMELRAVLENKDFLFVPGLFVQVRIAVSKPIKQLTIPDTAVLYDQIGPYILVVDANNTVVLKRVTLGGVEQSMRAILKGLDAQDKVIISGVQNATPGNKVNPQEQKSENAPK